YLRLQILVVRGCVDEFLAGSLIQSCDMELILTYGPPPRESRADYETWNHFAPNQSLHVLRYDEILFRCGECIREVGERTQEIGTTSRCNSYSDKTRHIPDVHHSFNRHRREVVRAHKQWIIVKNLSAGRLVIGIIQPHE